ncbi:MAG: hypothetical protein APR54_07570 [Candidatus Cloacimonas sp. SDB]|nr:MAG: hypothetical protein APR54_07570 [Candidatus Cloacimonas sp. SDB]
MRYIFSLIILLLLYATNTLCNTIIVDINGTGDFIAIQAGIEAAVESDTLLVYPGIYYENINFNGKNIVVASLLLTTGDESYIYNTIIDANFNGRVVTFENNETNDAVLMGFTIQNGFAITIFDLDEGAGIYVDFSSPSLKYLKIINNTAIFGAGISISSSNACFEGLIIKQNHAFKNAGGLTIFRRAPYPENSYPIFNSENRCSIYNNTAGYAADIYIAENHIPITNIHVDTLTVIDPDWNYVSQFPNLELDIQHQWQPQIEADLYVSSDGDDDNSGLSAFEPFKTIQWALTRIKADSLHPRNIYLAPGIYSPELNDQQFPLNMRANVSVVGAGMNEIFLTDPYPECNLIYAYYDDNYSVKSMTLSNCTSEYLGYAVFSEYSRSNFDYIKIFNYDGDGEAIRNYNADCKITNSIFFDNKGLGAIKLGTVYDNHANVYLNNLIFSDNQPSIYSDNDGGISLSIYNIDYAKITNCLFINNEVDSDFWFLSHIIFNNNSNIDFFNNTITCNSGYGSVLTFDNNNEINIRNCIIYDNNTPWLFSDSHSDHPMYVNLSHSIIDGGTEPAIIHIAGPGEYSVEYNWEEGILGLEPGFIEGDPEDPLSYQLLYDSPAIDSGTPDTTGLNLPEYDLAGNPRIYGDYIDIGAYEWQGVGFSDDLIKLSDYGLTCFPNPFHLSGYGRSHFVTIHFTLPVNQETELVIYNIKGQRIKTLHNGILESGVHEFSWDGKNNNNKSVPSGVYFVSLKQNRNHVISKILYLR